MTISSGLAPVRRRQLLLGLVPALWPRLVRGQRLRRHSGRVARVDLTVGLVVVEELAERGRMVLHEVIVGPTTPIVVASRLRPREMRGPRAFEERSASLADLLEGDFVVVEGAEADGGFVARRITIVEPAPPAPPAR